MRANEEWLRKYKQRGGRVLDEGKTLTDNLIASATANMEQAVRDELGSEEADEGLDTPVCLTVHQVRRRLADLDNLSPKAAIDGLIAGRVLADDGPKIVVIPTLCTQEQGKEESTVIKIYEAKEIR